MTNKNSNAIRSLAMMATFGAVVLVKTAYRPWVRERGINDLGLADWGPSFLMLFGIALGVCYVFGALDRTKRCKWVALLLAVIGGLIYEGLQASTGRLTFDVCDVIATLAGCVAGYVVDRRIEVDADQADQTPEPSS